MSNKGLIYLLSSVLLSAASTSNVAANTVKPAVDPAHIEQLTQSVASGVLTKLSMLSDGKPTLQDMSLEKVVSEALHAGKSIEDIRTAVSLTMEELTGKPLGHSVAQEVESETVTQLDAEATPVSIAAEEESAVTESSSERTIPLTTVLLPNESLSSVAKRIYGPDQDRRYLDIYEMNKDVITNINVVPEGTVLKLPE